MGLSRGRLGAILGPLLRPVLLALAVLGHLGPSWGRSWSILGHLRAILGYLGTVLGPSWAPLGHHGAVLGLSRGRLGAILGPLLGPVLPSLAIFILCSAILSHLRRCFAGPGLWRVAVLGSVPSPLSSQAPDTMSIVYPLNQGNALISQPSAGWSDSRAHLSTQASFSRVGIATARATQRFLQSTWGNFISRPHKTECGR